MAFRKNQKFYIFIKHPDVSAFFNTRSAIVVQTDALIIDNKRNMRYANAF